MTRRAHTHSNVNNTEPGRDKVDMSGESTILRGGDWK